MRNLDEVKKKYEEVIKDLADPGLISDWEKFERHSKEKKFLEDVIEKSKMLEEIKKRLEENKTILDTENDPDLISLAQEELNELLIKQKNLEKCLENLLKEDKEINHKIIKSRAVIVEIRAGAGGEEAALFAQDLFRMYSHYGEKQNWKQKVLNSHPTELGGLKEIIFEFTPHHFFPKSGGGDNISSKMQYEAGVHRVQRIPATEKSGRIHTSTASVAVLPKPKKAEIKIKPSDLKIDTYRASGPGGQYVQKTESAVRLTHLPSGLVVASQTERNQVRNKENALAILEAKLLQKREAEEAEKISGKRKAQIKWAKRAEKIRTYNFPQDRVTDHRIKKSWHNIEKIMAGQLDEIIQTLKKSDI